MKNKALVLDLDDTLYAEIDFLYSAYHHIAFRLAPEQEEMLFNRLVERYHRGENAFQYLTERYDVDLATLLEWYRFHIPDIHLFPHVEEQLNLFKSDWRFALVTDGRSVTQRNKVKALGLEPLLDCMVISEEVGSEKPSLNNYRLVEDALQCKDYIYIGDNPKKDFVTPNKLGWKTICLRDRGTNIHKQDFEIPHEFRPHFYMSDWSDLPTILNF
ncbi:HAD family hydrolase [Actinobacillus succinogenes]|uniref:HAD-superfamily hydrolase, subfamily IA, variant 1 n=1 Tax=Actinobacillus succinogenes (strain ATCC 55618 / DSM 22257 / CCUG 43843 / 130Z) TaxID=339671 RepID=A6VKI3_ACTSZ|nr:HAD family hydrolase [Actinobacillus succinogenes]ABR73480.1 HAD-superfamily hydrolase, subfamily IA, variant 1 [Actinobacillus succinogenes 130Z]PHI40056.1 HAD family hydrolase [Actinobacillus succinogenes]